MFQTKNWRYMQCHLRSGYDSTVRYAGPVYDTTYGDYTGAIIRTDRDKIRFRDYNMQFGWMDGYYLYYNNGGGGYGYQTVDMTYDKTQDTALIVVQWGEPLSSYSAPGTIEYWWGK